MRAVATRGPVVVAIDDMHWLDRASLAALRFALVRIERELVAALLTTRGEVPDWLRRAWPEQRLLTVELEPLSIGALHELLSVRLGRSIPRPALRRIWETSGGNPFFALELARALELRGGRLAPGEELPLPADLSALVRERLDQLSRPAFAVARVAAGLAEPTVELVGAAVGRQAEVGLDDALEAGVLELDGDRVRFSHPLLRSAVAAPVTPGRRRALHARLAAVVRDPEQEARHLALAASGPDETVAAALDDAARRARARGAPAAAADLAEQALRLTRPGDDARVRRTVDAADHAFVSGDPTHAAELLESELGEAPRGTARAAILRRLARIRTRATGPRDGVALYREALRETEGDDALVAEIELELAYTLRLTADLSSADPHARAAVVAAERAGDDELLCRALSVAGLIHFNLGRGLDRAAMERALALEESLGRPVRGIGAKASLFDQLRWTDELDRAREVAEEVRAELHSRDDPLEADVLALLALIDWRAGDWERADKLDNARRALHEQSGWTEFEPMQAWPGAVIAAHRGRLDEAREVAERGVELAAAAGSLLAAEMYRWLLGFVELSRGDPRAALAQLRPARVLREELHLLEPGSRFELPDLLDALVAVGELEEAEAVVGPWEERARRLGRAWALAIAGRCRALLHAARGDLTGALEVFDAALAVHERAPDPFQRARTLLALGAVQRRARRRAAARATLTDALAAFEGLGAPAWAEQARVELGRIGGRAPSPGGLTPTEHRVAALVAEGRPTKEVAGVLFVSPKTIEKHLTRIYAKLDVHSRAELAHKLVGREQSGGDSPIS
jgi:DNA-binding CsgD family transcriptional regulator/tetratricopeptide (TPR) repeat protein